MADQKESALAQKNDFQWVRALDANGNSIRINKDDFAKVLEELIKDASLTKRGLMTTIDVLYNRPLAFPFIPQAGYVKILSSMDGLYNESVYEIRGDSNAATSENLIVQIRNNSIATLTKISGRLKLYKDSNNNIYTDAIRYSSNFMRVIYESKANNKPLVYVSKEEVSLTEILPSNV